MHIVTWPIDELANCCCTNTEARRPCTRDKPHWRWDYVRMMGLSYSQSHLDHMLPSRNDVHRHRVEAATCILRSEDRNRLVAFTRPYAAQQGRCAQTPYGGSRTHTQRRRSQPHGAVPKWLIRLANPLRFSGPARPRDDKKNKR